MLDSATILIMMNAVWVNVAPIYLLFDRPG